MLLSNMEQTPQPHFSRHKIKSSTRGLVIGYTQTLSARVCRLYLRLNAGYEVRNDVHFVDTKPYLFIANHQSRIDPFVTFALLSLRENFQIKPVRFMTARGIYFSPLRPMLKLLGCYPTRRQGVDSIDLSAQYLAQGYGVMIFPEGRRTLRSESDPRPGIERLVAASPAIAAPVLVHIEWEVKNRFQKKPTVHLTEVSLDSLRNQTAKEIVEQVYAV